MDGIFGFGLDDRIRKLQDKLSGKKIEINAFDLEECKGCQLKYQQYLLDSSKNRFTIHIENFERTKEFRVNSLLEAKEQIEKLRYKIGDFAIIDTNESEWVGSDNTKKMVHLITYFQNTWFLSPAVPPCCADIIKRIFNKNYMNVAYLSKVGNMYGFKIFREEILGLIHFEGYSLEDIENMFKC